MGGNDPRNDGLAGSGPGPMVGGPVVACGAPVPGPSRPPQMQEPLGWPHPPHAIKCPYFPAK